MNRSFTLKQLPLVCRMSQNNCYSYPTSRSVRVKETVFKIHDHCSNRLNKDTRECMAYWNAIETFNHEIEYVYHTLKYKESPWLDENAIDSVIYDV